MNKKELSNYIFNFWLDWGAYNYEPLSDEEILKSIEENLSTTKGIERELNFIKHEFEAGWSEESLEYKNLKKLQKLVNDYKEGK